MQGQGFSWLAYARTAAAGSDDPAPTFLLTLVLIDIVVRVAHALNLLRIFVGNLDSELFFKAHDQLDGVERIGAEVIDESRVWCYFILIHAELIDDNLFYFLLNLLIGHSFAPLSSTNADLSICKDLFLKRRQTEVCRTNSKPRAQR